MSFYAHDVFHFLSKLTIRKIFNVITIFSSYYGARILKRPVLWGLPFTVSVEPTTSCNLRCPECPSGLRSFTRATGMMDIDLFDLFLNETQQHLIYCYFYFQGEPYLHPDFLVMVKKAAQKKIYTVTSTNAHFLDEEKAKQTVLSGLSRIIISIDGATQDTYEKYRVGGQLEKVLKGTKNLIAQKKLLHSKTPHIILQFLVVKPNQHEIDKLYQIAEQLGVDEVKLKTAQIYDFEKGNDLIPTLEKYSRYKKTTDGRYEIKNKLLNQCWKMWHSCVITWDGAIVPCCFDKDAKYKMGSLQNTSFKKIWTSNPYLLFRRQLLKSRKEIDICKNCTEGLKVWES